MKYRILGKTGYRVSEISLGCWQIGGKWGEPFDADLAKRTLHEAVDRGVTFLDTADAYSGGESEAAVGTVVKERSEEIHVATKCGRKLSPHTADGYNRENITGFVEASLSNMKVDALDLVQLHCPPTEVYYRPEVFQVLDDLQSQGKIRHYGVSVEKVEEGLKAIEYPGVASVQIIFNVFRQRPAELFFREAQRRNVGIIVRVPLASGLLTGKFTKESQFAEGDHRTFNRNGEAFDRGETFAGVDYETGVEAATKLQQAFAPKDATMAQLALRWILMFDEVSCTIPGASRPEQAADNANASDLPPLSTEQMEAAQEIYDEMIRPQVHQRW
jgi:aryl-alcohol dehydrogenase-like predicted oxidoreductase